MKSATVVGAVAAGFIAAVLANISSAQPARSANLYLGSPSTVTMIRECLSKATPWARCSSAVLRRAWNQRIGRSLSSPTTRDARPPCASRLFPMSTQPTDLPPRSGCVAGGATSTQYILHNAGHCWPGLAYNQCVDLMQGRVCGAA